MYKLKNHMNSYQDPNFDFMIKFLKNTDMTDGVSDSVLWEMSYGLKFDYVEKDHYIFSFGQSKWAIYFIISGNVEISTPLSKGSVIIETLYWGCSMGTYTTLFGSSIEFSAFAREHTLFFTLDYDYIW